MSPTVGATHQSSPLSAPTANTPPFGPHIPVSQAGGNQRLSVQTIINPSILLYNSASSDAARTPTPHTANLFPSSPHQAPLAPSYPFPIPTHRVSEALNDPEPDQDDFPAGDAVPYPARVEYWRQRLTPAEFVKWSALNPPPAQASLSEREATRPVDQPRKSPLRAKADGAPVPLSPSLAPMHSSKKRGHRISHASSSQTVLPPQLDLPSAPPRHQDQENDPYQEEQETVCEDEHPSGTAEADSSSHRPTSTAVDTITVSNQPDTHLLTRSNCSGLGLRLPTPLQGFNDCSAGPTASPALPPHVLQVDGERSDEDALPPSNTPDSLNENPYRPYNIRSLTEDSTSTAIDGESFQKSAVPGAPGAPPSPLGTVALAAAPTQPFAQAAAVSAVKGQMVDSLQSAEASDKLPAATPVIPFPSRRSSASATNSTSRVSSPIAPPDHVQHGAIRPQRSQSAFPGSSPTAISPTPPPIQSVLTAQRRPLRSPNDFSFGDLLGEGSYSSVLIAWDESSGQCAGSPTPGVDEKSDAPVSMGDTTVDRRVSAAEAIAGVPAASLVAKRAKAQGKTAYAVKVLYKAHIIREKKSRYVGIEKEALSRCVRLKGVVTLYWTFQDRENLYFVLELAPNGDLQGQIRKMGSISLQLTRYWAAQIAQTLAAIHKVGVVHRDMKPENILLDAHWRIRITDFGSAKCTARDAQGAHLSAAMTSDGPASRMAEPPASESGSKYSFVGTAEFVSPELLDSKQTTAASDWWAFGAIVFTLLAGAPPFRGPSEYTTFQKILHDPIPFPPAFPSVASSFVRAFLQRDPLRRLSEATWSTLVRHPFFREHQEQSSAPMVFPSTQGLSPDATLSASEPQTDGVEGELPAIWNSLWTKPAPPLEPGIVVRPETPEEERTGNVFALFDTESEVVPTEDERAAISVYSQSVASRSIRARTSPRDGVAGNEFPAQAASAGPGSAIQDRRASSISALTGTEVDPEVDDADNEDDDSAYEPSLYRCTSSATGPRGLVPAQIPDRARPTQVLGNKLIGRPPLHPLTTTTSSASSPPGSIKDADRNSVTGMDRTLPFIREKLKSTKLRHKAKRQISRALLAAQGDHTGHSQESPAASAQNAARTAWPATSFTQAPTAAPGRAATSPQAVPSELSRSAASSSPPRITPTVANAVSQRGTPARLHHPTASTSSHASSTAASKAATAVLGQDAKPPSPSRSFFRRPSVRASSAARNQTSPTPSTEDRGETGSALTLATGGRLGSAHPSDPSVAAGAGTGASAGAEGSRESESAAWRLRPGENMVLMTPVLQRKSGPAYLFSPKRRDLVLTDRGRLVCLKPPLGLGTLKIEFILAPWARPGTDPLSSSPSRAAPKAGKMADLQSGFGASGPLPSSSASPPLPTPTPTSASRSPSASEPALALKSASASAPAPAPARVSAPTLAATPPPKPVSAPSPAYASTSASAQEPEVVTFIEGRGSKVFVLTTASRRQFYYEDPSGDNAHWLWAIRRAMASPAPLFTISTSGNTDANTNASTDASMSTIAMLPQEKALSHSTPRRNA